MAAAGSQAAALDAPARRWSAGRQALLPALALLCCGLLALLLRLLLASPLLDVQASAGADGRLILQSGRTPELQALQGRVLLAVGAPGGRATAVDAALLHRVPRWQPDAARRAQSLVQHAALAEAARSGHVALHLDDGRVVTLATPARKLAGLGLLAALLGLAALALPLFGAAMCLARPSLHAALLGLVCAAQALSLGFVLAESTRGLALPPALLQLDLPVRLALDVVSATAAVHAFAGARRPALAAGLWIGSALLLAALMWAPERATEGGGLSTPSWAWGQTLCAALALAALAALWRPAAGTPDPRRRITARLALTALLVWLLANAAVLASAGNPGLAPAIATGTSTGWGLFIVSLLLLVPSLTRSRRLLREGALLAGMGCLAVVLDLLLVGVFAVAPSASMVISVVIALALYAWLRQHMLERLLGLQLLTTDRIFELLYRAAREVQRRPDLRHQRLAQLLRELFDPLEMVRSPTVPRQAEVQDGGAVLVVALRPDGADGRPGLALRLRLAGRGRRLFMPEDARLADRVVEQLRRAVAYDRAVERGRHEERQRLAQDLHDDIGARLLTLMYQAPTPELEDYIRHTLQDLKTLTRGLAAAEHRLGLAAAEWKSDLSHRVNAARATLGWHCQVDEAMRLTVVQWSALTRVLRELVSNALYHGHAQRVDVSLALSGNVLTLSVADDGVGRDPAAWAHGLGLGGVRKRVKQLGGRVEWRERGERGIVCSVVVDHFREVE